ncbi:MAG: ABC transporter permease [Bifidobacteriaceae bacterium]|jgi:putative ABC transport system permease protein|nr:ABC transporter permease [Bifidobacteriaceae bacterium]
MLLDILQNSFQNLSAKKTRTMFMMLGTVLSIACLVSISSVLSTMSGQMAENFNELQDTHITIVDQATKNSNSNGFNFASDSVSKITHLNGVVNSAVFYTVLDTSENQFSTISKQPRANIISPEASPFSIMGANNSLFFAIDAKFRGGVAYNSYHENSKSKIAVLGSSVAEKIGISDQQIGTTIFYNNDPYYVAGILSQNNVLSDVNTSVIIPLDLALERYSAPIASNPAKMIIKVNLGAANLISTQAPLALNYYNPRIFQAVPIPDWSNFTNPVSDNLKILTSVIIIIAILTAIISIGVISSYNVQSRKKEIGLARALGSGKRRIFLTFIFEAGLVGFIGAIIGTTLGILILLFLSLINSWTPVFDIVFCLLSPIIGILVGVLAAFLPAYQASKLSPILALRD